ncbi:zinc ribbon domain-containing protein [Staphylococcus simulans]|uniref:zinc ribbon domain-containing protein n=1 Tax=Staphylococcus simulans TaxID=1286 RepID=UPI001E3FA13B|nr:zinc ribbon domain-containing protein [Staphylococcus simulans]MCD8915416.1 zinc ribbon domain-containing protein [Staphylococcus simulans]
MKKICTTCKNKLNSNEKYCTNCGTAASHNQFSRSDILHYKQDNSNLKTFVWCSVLVVVFLALIAGLIYWFFVFCSNQIGQAQPKASALPKTHKVNVDVNSAQFSQGYMHTSNTEGYEGFELGETKNGIEKEYGISEGTKTIDGNKAELYGDIGVSYNKDNKVDHVYVVPDKMTKDAFTDFHNAPDEISNGIWYYDLDKSNGFTIKAYTSKHHIEAIENITQR